MKNPLELAFLAIVALATTGCSESTAESSLEPATNKPEWSRNAVIYEVNWRQATDDGTAASFAKKLPYLKELGVDILWFMPVNPISEVNRKGELGSYYASQNYTALNPELGTIDEFKNMVSEAHNLGMKVIIDWVANHTGCDNVWLTEHPEWYVYDENGKLVSPWDWTDTYKLNYENKEMRQAMVDAMKFWVSECDIDGFRCDVAFMVPLDFWKEARRQLEEIKPVFLLAEAANKELCDGAFDMVYNWPLLFLYDKIAKGEKNCSVIDSIVCAERDSFPVDAYQMNHITNHDRNSWDGTEFERLGLGTEAFAVLSYIVPGMPLIYTGQEVGYDHRFEFFKKDRPAPLVKNHWYYLYQNLNNLKHSNKALRAGIEGGCWKVFETTEPDKALVCSRELGDDKVMYVANLSNEPVKFSLTNFTEKESFSNYFKGGKVSVESGQEFSLAPWEYLLLVK